MRQCSLFGVSRRAGIILASPAPIILASLLMVVVTTTTIAFASNHFPALRDLAAAWRAHPPTCGS
jgi:hypothetical protein